MAKKADVAMLRNVSSMVSLVPQARDAIEEVWKELSSRISKLAIGTTVEQSSPVLTRLKSRAASQPWPDDPAIVAGAGPTDTFAGNERIWYITKPDGADAALSASVQAFNHWLDAGTVMSAIGSDNQFELDIVDQIGDSSIVVRSSIEDQLQIRRDYPALRLLPSAELYPQMVRVTSLNAGPSLTVPPGTGKPVLVAVSEGSNPLPDLLVRGYLGDGRRVEGVTDSNGLCTLHLPKVAPASLAVSAVPTHSYWSRILEVDLASYSGAIVPVVLDPLRPSWIPAFTPRLGPGSLDVDGHGVKVAVVDTGVSNNHSLLQVAGGASTVVQEINGLDWNDTSGHGTMVAGLIAARGDGIVTPRGLAPACELYAYRVFAHGSLRAQEVAVSKAITQAVNDGCDVINLSLGGTIPMLEVQRAMDRAESQGVVCIVSAGNGRRKPVSYPACYPEALAVSAMGRLHAYPEDSEFALSQSDDEGVDPANFVATFTNVGTEVDLCAPGVGIVSCWLQDKLAAMDGTSFSAPLVTGLVARALGAQTGRAILQMPRNRNRAEAIKKLAVGSAKSFGFHNISHEGHGLPG